MRVYGSIIALLKTEHAFRPNRLTLLRPWGITKLDIRKMVRSTQENKKERT